MKKLIIFLFFISFIGGYSQDKPSFFIEVPDVNYIPVVTHDNKGNKIGTSKTGNKSLDALINSYEIYSNERVFKGSNKVLLQNIYLIGCNDIQLMNDLYAQFQQFYPRIESANGEPLSIPNDFGTTGGFIEIQEELNYIRAPEAWDITTGSGNIIIGISDGHFNPNHEDLIDKMEIVVNESYNNPAGSPHGNNVASVAAAETNNAVGMAAIGYNSFIYAGYGHSTSVDYDLSLLDGVKVLNASWGFIGNTTQPITNAVYEDINNRKIVMVAAAGNGANNNSTGFYIPASFKNVISVSSVSHETANWTDTWNNTYQTVADSHEIIFNGERNVHQHNDSVDIVAPGYAVLVADVNSYVRSGGTSYATPMVSGTIALMFDVNYCIDPKEVETILKLTAVRIDHLPQNIQYYGKLGAGKLDAYEAVKMAKDMADAYGTVEVKNRILYRPWFYKLETAPYEIKMTNNDVTGGSKLKFKARNNIEILSGDYYPSTGGYMDLSIDSTLALNCPPPPVRAASRSINDDDINVKNPKSNFEVMPTLVTQDISITNKAVGLDIMSQIKVYDFYGTEVFKEDKINSDSIILNLGNLVDGIYILKVFNKKGETLHTQKIVKN